MVAKLPINKNLRVKMKKRKKENQVKKLICPVCGFAFNPNENQACSSCPLKSKCQVVCCPNCGYQTVVKAEFTDFIARLFSKERGKNGRT